MLVMKKIFNLIYASLELELARIPFFDGNDKLFKYKNSCFWFIFLQ